VENHRIHSLILENKAGQKWLALFFYCVKSRQLNMDNNNKEYLLSRITVMLEKISRKSGHDLLPLLSDIISILTICQSYLISEIDKKNGSS
jgi:hypothetical protein